MTPDKAIGALTPCPARLRHAAAFHRLAGSSS